MEQKLKILEKSIGYSFKDKGLLENALIHPSYTNENPKINFDNQRMEFLGDAVLKLIISDYIFKKNNDLAEGKLSILQNNLISNETLANIAKKINLSNFLILGKGEIKNNGYHRESNLADTLEAIIGAVWLDGSLTYSKKVIYFLYNDLLKENINNLKMLNPKGELQELLQEKNHIIPEYNTISVSGPEHAREFTVSVEVYGKKFLHKSSSIQAAQIECAKEALLWIEKTIII